MEAIVTTRGIFRHSLGGNDENHELWMAGIPAEILNGLPREYNLRRYCYTSANFAILLILIF
jgi:hypothetical protein